MDRWMDGFLGLNRQERSCTNNITIIIIIIMYLDQIRTYPRYAIPDDWEEFPLGVNIHPFIRSKTNNIKRSKYK